ncbi:MAG: hypothetical protein ACJ8J7_17240 [Sulfurifustaceae bacterium]
MFIGHFGVAFGVKRVVPEVKLGTAILATAFIDVLWPFFVAAGVEVVRISPGATDFTPLRFVSYPFSHSLAMVLLWAGLFALAYVFSGGSRRAAFWLGLVVASHWFLDLIVHEPDLQLFPELDIYVGLGLWDSIAGTLVVEGLIFVAGLALYLSATRPRDRIGTWALVGLVALLLLAYFASAFGPPPPSVRAIVISAIVGTAVTLALAYWVDRHREERVRP